MTAKVMGLVQAVFAGKNGSGAISVPGVKAGDYVTGIYHDTVNYLAPGSIFETIVSVDDEVQQTSATDYTSITFTVNFLRTA